MLDYDKADKVELPACSVESEEVCEGTAEYMIGIRQEPICRMCIPDWVYTNMELGSIENTRIEAIIKMKDFHA